MSIVKSLQLTFGKALIFSALLAPGLVSAAVLDFDTLDYTNITTGGTVTPTAASVLTNQFASDGIVFGQAGVSAGVAVMRSVFDFAPSSGLGSIVGLDAAGDIPGVSNTGSAVGDLYFSFLGITDFVSFTVGDGGGDLDIFDIRVYDGSNALISNNHYENNSRFLVELAMSNIARVEVDFTGSYGYSLDDLTFNTVQGVPEPATLGLLALGLLTLGFKARKRT